MAMNLSASRTGRALLHRKMSYFCLWYSFQLEAGWTPGLCAAERTGRIDITRSSHRISSRSPPGLQRSTSSTTLPHLKLLMISNRYASPSQLQEPNLLLLAYGRTNGIEGQQNVICNDFRSSLQPLPDLIREPRLFRPVFLCHTTPCLPYCNVLIVVKWPPDGHVLRGDLRPNFGVYCFLGLFQSHARPWGSAYWLQTDVRMCLGCGALGTASWPGEG
jgi:hypothetical protein